MSHDIRIAIDLPPGEAETLALVLQQGGFTTRPVQHRDLDWQTIMVVIRDAGDIAAATTAIIALAERIIAYRKSRRDQGKTAQGTLRRAGQPPLELAHATDKEVLEWLLKTLPQD